MEKLPEYYKYLLKNLQAEKEALEHVNHQCNNAKKALEKKLQEIETLRSSDAGTSHLSNNIATHFQELIILATDYLQKSSTVAGHEFNVRQAYDNIITYTGRVVSVRDISVRDIKDE